MLFFARFDVSHVGYPVSTSSSSEAALNPMGDPCCVIHRVSCIPMGWDEFFLSRFCTRMHWSGLDRIAKLAKKKRQNDWGSLLFMFLFYILEIQDWSSRRMACFLLAQDWKGASFACHDGKIWKDMEKVCLFFMSKRFRPFLRCHMVPHGATETRSAPERHVQVWPSLFASIP